MILLVDSYDSFTHNIVQGLCVAGAEVRVMTHDDPHLMTIDLAPFSAVLIGPGPGRPADAGQLLPFLGRLVGRLPILGICLGMQAIAEHFGGEVVAAPEPLHGVVASIRHDGRGLFAGLDSPIEATRYHSLCVAEASLPPDLEITARSEDGVPMGLRHRQMPIAGLQFHPESIASPCGQDLLRAFVEGWR